MSIKDIIRTVKRNDLIITPVIELWLLKHGDDALPDWVIARLVEVMSTPPRDRSGSFSGSAAGQCLRRQELQFAGVRGEATDSQLQNIFNDGKYRHLRWQGYLLTTGLITDIEYLVQWRRYLARGSLDGRGIVSDNHLRKKWRGLEFGVELKGVSTFQFGAYKAHDDEQKEEHLNQIARYFLLGGFELFATIYEDKTTQAWVEWVDEPDPERMEKTEKEVKELYWAVKSKTMHSMLRECRRGRGKYITCPFGVNGACEMAQYDIPKPFKRSA